MASARATLRQLADELASVPIVITGGTGFVGLALVDAVMRARRAPLYVLDLHPLKPELVRHLPHHEAYFQRIDLTDRAAVSELARSLPERFALVHAASLVSTRSALEQAALRELDVSAAMVLSMLDAFGSRIAAACFISSFEVYGKLDPLTIEERHPSEPTRVYGIGKLIAEALFESGGRTHGFPVSMLRLSHVYGRFEHITSATHELRAGRAIPSFLRNAMHERPILLNGDGGDLRDYVHVDDVAQAMLRALLGANRGAYLIASGQSVSMREVAQTCVRACQSSSAIQQQPRKGERADFKVSIDKARKELGYVPLVSLDEGLLDEARVMKQVGLHV